MCTPISRVKLVSGLLLATVIVLGVATDAKAALALRLSDTDGNTVAVEDNMAGDIDDRLGVIVHFGMVGNFTLNVTTGLGMPFMGSANVPMLDLNSIDTSSYSGGALTIELTQTGFTGSPMGLDPVAFLASIGGVTDGTVTVEAFIGVGAFDDSILLSTMTFTNGAFSGATPSEGHNLFDELGISETDPEYSLTLRVTIEHGSGTNTTSFNATLNALPEPSGLLVWGGIAFCALCTGTLRRRRP